MNKNDLNLIPVKNLLTDKKLRTLFYDSFVNSEDINESNYINQFLPNKCPYCGENKILYIGPNRKNINVFQCESCKKQFNLLTKTSLAIFSRPLTNFYEFLEDLFTKHYLYEKSLNSKNMQMYLKMFEELSKHLFKASSKSKPFSGENVALHIFSYPNEVYDLEKLRNSNDLQNYIIAILSDGIKVKMRIIGTGCIDKRILNNRLSKLINKNSTLIHTGYHVLDDLVFNLNLNEKIIIGNEENIKESKELNYVIDLENEFRQFVNYYTKIDSTLFLDMYMVTFEFLQRKIVTIDEKIAFLFSLVLNVYSINDREIFNYHRVRYEKDISFLEQ